MSGIFLVFFFYKFSECILHKKVKILTLNGHNLDLRFKSIEINFLTHVLCLKYSRSSIKIVTVAKRRPN